jgi:hypothetical protein
MSRFMVLTHDTPHNDQPSLAETKALVEGHSAFAHRLRSLSVLVDAERLRPVDEGRRVANRNNQLRVDGGPFDEPAVTGYYVVEAPTLDVAVDLVAECPLLPDGELEVRPLVNGNLGPDKSSVQGHVFGFAVLGNAASEERWHEVMAHIAASSPGDFRDANVLGGVRLEPPRLGKRVRATRGGHRTVFDGPFLESKEVIGGFFFMRMPSMSDAVRFVGQTEFVKIGTAEIRELWRT